MSSRASTQAFCDPRSPSFVGTGRVLDPAGPPPHPARPHHPHRQEDETRTVPITVKTIEHLGAGGI